MAQKIFLIILAAFVMPACNNSKNTDMTTGKNETDTKYKSVTGYAPVNGLKMYYEIHGEGMPVVLIHGGGSTIQTTFGSIIPLLAPHYRIISVELQAHGHTNDRNGPESFEQDADDVAGLLQHLKINKAHFFGFSNGGNTTMRIATRHPEIVNKLVVVSSFYKREGMMKGFFEGLEKASIEDMPQLLKTYYLQINNDQKGLQAMFDKDKERMVHFKDWNDDDLQSIKAPTFLISGDRDVVTVEHTVKMSHLIPNAQLMILPGPHGAFIGEVCATEKESKMPGISAAIIREFLDK